MLTIRKEQPGAIAVIKNVNDKAFNLPQEGTIFDQIRDSSSVK